MEGFGGPVNLDQYHLAGIDPCLEDCCRREVCRKRQWNGDGFCALYMNMYIHVFIYSTCIYMYLYLYLYIYIYAVHIVYS